MIQADDTPMPARGARQARLLAMPIAALAITLALPACDEASAGDMAPPREPAQADTATPAPFVPLNLSRQTAKIG
uniref:hypothetical protein n=1 Tax=Novosphingobium rosa TaxID=76978 RepID=UPI000AF8E62B